MRIRLSRAARGVALVAAVVLATSAVGAAQVASYLDFDGLTRELRAVTGASNLATMESLGTTLEGRDVWMVMAILYCLTPLAIICQKISELEKFQQILLNLMKPKRISNP